MCCGYDDTEASSYSWDAGVHEACISAAILVISKFYDFSRTFQIAFILANQDAWSLILHAQCLQLVSLLCLWPYALAIADLSWLDHTRLHKTWASFFWISGIVMYGVNLSCLKTKIYFTCMQQDQDTKDDNEVITVDKSKSSCSMGRYLNLAFRKERGGGGGWSSQPVACIKGCSAFKVNCPLSKAQPAKTVLAFWASHTQTALFVLYGTLAFWTWLCVGILPGGGHGIWTAQTQPIFDSLAVQLHKNTMRERFSRVLFGYSLVATSEILCKWCCALSEIYLRVIHLLSLTKRLNTARLNKDHAVGASEDWLQDSTFQNQNFDRSTL